MSRGEGSSGYGNRARRKRVDFFVGTASRATNYRGREASHHLASLEEKNRRKKGRAGESLEVWNVIGVQNLQKEIKGGKKIQASNTTAQET